MELMYRYVKEYLTCPGKTSSNSMETPHLDTLLKMPEKFGKPLMISSFFDRSDHCIRVFHEHAIPCLDSPEKAARAMACCTGIHSSGRKPPRRTGTRWEASPRGGTRDHGPPEGVCGG